MQNSTKSLQASQNSKRSSQENIQSFDGEYVARLFKFYRMQQNPHLHHVPPLKLVPFKSLYNRHREAFDSFAKLANKNNFNVEPYIKWCVKCGIDESELDVCLMSSTMMNKYIVHLKSFSKRKDIYKWFIKSVKNIATECVDNGYFTTKDFLRMLIDTHQIGAYVAAGKISVYFFAAIPNFNRVVEKLDHFSRIELRCLEEYFDIYHSDVNKAFILAKNKMINPIDVTDALISKMRSKQDASSLSSIF